MPLCQISAKPQSFAGLDAVYKMLMEEMLNNTAWCSTGVLQTETLEMFLTV